MLLNTYNHSKFAFSSEIFSLNESTTDSWGIIGVPFDSTSSYHTNSRFGPLTVREASHGFEVYNSAFDLNIDTVFYDFDDLNVAIGNCKKTNDILEETVSELIDNGIKPLIIGGEHSISYGVLKALAKDENAPDISDMVIVHFDAHRDLIDDYLGEKYSHATVMKRIYDLNPNEIIQVGIRSQSEEEKVFVDNNSPHNDGNKVSNITTTNTNINTTKITTFTSKDINDSIVNAKNYLANINAPIYLSIDIDVLDASYVPSVGNPLPNGLSSNDLEEFIEVLAKKDIIGFDMVEVAADKLGDITAIAGAKIIYDFLTLVNR